MPIPVIVWAVGAGIAAVAAAAGATAYAWEKPARGKKITLIGPKKAGKTTWRTFLETGTVPAGYKHTNVTEIIDKDFRLGDLKMKIRVSDMSGSSAALGEWREYSESADHVYFLIDITELADDDYFDEARRFANQVSLWTSLTADLTLVATHADRDPEWKNGDGYDDLRTRSAVTNLRQLMGASEVLVADLSSDSGCVDFTMSALTHFTKPK